MPCSQRLIANTITFALEELLKYKPVRDFLNMELAMTIYKHIQGQIAQFPHNYMKNYIDDYTNDEYSLKAFIKTIKEYD